ncbi:hypothetical protein A1F94_009017 [Pyrenophora tritici-repentis]|nr:hypothetical protein A1F94_009017 [Pyrenophora tritici-repentis]
MSGIPPLRIPFKEGSPKGGYKRTYAAYLDQTTTPTGHHNIVAASSTLAVPQGLRTDNKTYLPYPNGLDPEHARKAHETPEFLARASYAYRFLGSRLCNKIAHLDTIHLNKVRNNKPLSQIPRQTRAKRSTKDKVAEIGQRVEAFVPLFDPRKVAPTVTSWSSTSTMATPPTPFEPVDLIPPVTTSSTPIGADTSTISVAITSASPSTSPSTSPHATSQNPTTQAITTIFTPAAVDIEQEVPLTTTDITVEVDDESSSGSNVDDDTAVSFVEEPTAQDPADIVKEDGNNFKDSGIFMEFPESFEVDDVEAVAQQLSNSVDVSDDDSVTQQSPASESNEHISSASNENGNAILDSVVMLDAVATVVAVEPTSDDIIDIQEASQSSFGSNIEDLSSTPESFEALDNFMNRVAQLEFYEGSLDEIRTRLMNIIKDHDAEEPEDDKRPTRRISKWFKKYMGNIAEVFLPFEYNLDEANGFKSEWFNQSCWSKPKDCSNLLRALLLLESMLVWSFEKIIHKEDKQKVTRALGRIRKGFPVEDLCLEMNTSCDIRKIIDERNAQIWKAENSNETRNNLLAASKLNPTDISKLLILAEHAPGGDTEVMGTLRIVLRRICGLLLYNGSESEICLPGWPKVARKPPKALHTTSTYEFLKDLQVQSFVSDFEHKFSVVAQLNGQALADVRVVHCLPLVRKVLQNLTLSEDECRSKLHKFFDVDFPMLGSSNINDILKEGLYDYATLARLLGYLTWLDALLDPFRNNILAEDVSYLIPQMQTICNERDRVITPELELQYLEIRKANPEAKTAVTETVDEAYKVFYEHVNKIRNSNRLRSALAKSINFGTSHEKGLTRLILAIGMTADPCENIDLVREVHDTLQHIWKTLIFGDSGCISGSGGASGLPKRADMSEYLDELYRKPGVGSWGSFLAHLDDPDVDMINTMQRDDSVQQDDSEVMILQIFDESSLTIPANQDAQGVLTPESYENVNVDPNKSEFGFWSFDEDKFLKWSNIHMTYLDNITALVTEIPEGGHNDRSLLRQVYYRNRTFEHIELTRKRIALYLNSHQRSAAIDEMLSILDHRQKMMNQIQPRVQHQSDLSKRPCPMVNTQEGCKDRVADVCQYNHDNEGKRCKSDQEGKVCKFNEKNKCCYVHLSPEEKLAQQATQGPSQVISGNFNRPCPYVNKPDSCAGELNGVCLFSHMNKGKVCKNFAEGRICKFGDTCSFIHQQDQASGYSQATGSMSPATDGPKSAKYFNACSFVNRPSGCNKGDLCAYDHSLQGVLCPVQNCSGTGCVYLHSSKSRKHTNPSNTAGGYGQIQSPVASQQGQPLPTPRTQGSGLQQHINTPERKATMKERIKAEHTKVQSRRQTPAPNAPKGPRSMQQQTGSLNWQPQTPLPQQDAISSGAASPFGQFNSFQGFQNTQPSGGFGSSRGRQIQTPAERWIAFQKDCEKTFRSSKARSSKAYATRREGLAPHNSRDGNQSSQHSYGGNHSSTLGNVAFQQSSGNNQTFGHGYNPFQQSRNGNQFFGQGNAASQQNRGSNQPFGHRNHATQQNRNANQSQGFSAKRPCDDDVEMTDDDIRPKRSRGWRKH